MNIYGLIGRHTALFKEDLGKDDHLLMNFVKKGSFLFIGGAGSIGQAVVKELFKRKPQVLHVVDINENNLVELVRDIRSSFGFKENHGAVPDAGEFKCAGINRPFRQRGVFQWQSVAWL